MTQLVKLVFCVKGSFGQRDFHSIKTQRIFHWDCYPKVDWKLIYSLALMKP